MNLPIRLLVVDDHALFLEGIKSVLNTIPGFEVVATARSGDEALYQLRRFRIDVMLLDINMPVRDGIEVMQIIHQQKLPVGVIGVSS